MNRIFFLLGLITLNGWAAWSQAYRADVKTVVSADNSQGVARLFLDPARTLSPLGSRIWFVADTARDGVPTNPPAGSILGADDVLISTDAVDGSLLGNQPGKFSRQGIPVAEARFAEADIYFYLWASTAPEDVPVAGDTFGLYKIGAVGPPEFGNASWWIAGDLFANEFVVRSSGSTEPPEITKQPLSQTVPEGSPVSFVVEARGTPPPSFQWFREETLLEGRTGASLSFEAVTPADAGSYHVVVSNSVKSVTSELAVLTVTPGVAPPVITSPPLAQRVVEGATVTFQVEATGTAPLAYQWLKGTEPIPGKTEARLVLTDVRLADAGPYSVTVSNPGGERTTEPALLTVDPVAPVEMSIALTAGGVLISWTGGRPPYVLEHLSRLNALQWMPVLTNTEPTAPPFAAEGDQGLFRVQSP